MTVASAGPGRAHVKGIRGLQQRQQASRPVLKHETSLVYNTLWVTFLKSSSFIPIQPILNFEFALKMHLIDAFNFKM